MLYSPDGLVQEIATGKLGIYEGKTAAILNNILKESWRDQIPNNYFIQLLHGIFVTGFEFAVLNDDEITFNTYSAGAAQNGLLNGLYVELIVHTA